MRPYAITQGLQLHQKDRQLCWQKHLGAQVPLLTCFAKCSGGIAPTSTEGSSVAADDLIPQLLSLLPAEAPMATDAAAGYVCTHQIVQKLPGIRLGAAVGAELGV